MYIVATICGITGLFIVIDAIASLFTIYPEEIISEGKTVQIVQLVAGICCIMASTFIFGVL